MAENTLKLRHVTIVGVGLLGGSAGLAIKSLDAKVHVAGVGRRKVSLAKALQVGAIDTAHLNAAEPAAHSDLIILATPVGAFARHLRDIAPVLAGKAVVTDVGSTKAAVVRIAGQILGFGARFVGSHPMAGSDRKGPTFARADLFAGANCILTPTPRTPPPVLRRVEGFWKALGMRMVKMSPAAHDRAMARVSHLPHVLAALLVGLPVKADLAVSATGFADMTRLAGGDPEMWRDILVTNRRAILNALDSFDDSLMQLRDLVELADAPGIEKFLAWAKKLRDGLPASRKENADRAVE